MKQKMHKASNRVLRVHRGSLCVYFSKSGIPEISHILPDLKAWPVSFPTEWPLRPSAISRLLSSVALKVSVTINTRDE